MALTIGRLDPFFTNLIDDLMVIERQPLTRLQAQRDAVQVRRDVYTDLDAKLEDLLSEVRALTSTNAFSVMSTGRAATVSSQTSGYQVVQATAGSSAALGSYDLSVNLLARAQRRASAEQPSADQALGLSGTFWLGGTGAASVSLTPNATITAAGTAAVAAGNRELATGSYSVETRDQGSGLEFRLVDVDGRALQIADLQAADGSLTSDWQPVVQGTVDTLRGLTLTFGSGTDASTTLSYTAAGVSVTVSTTDSLLDIAQSINDALQPEGREIAATVVGRQLVLTAQRTGTAHTMIYDDQVGLGISTTDLQSARDASFTVDGIAFTRSSNTGLTDVIHGVTLDLQFDAEGQSATIRVEADTSAVRQGVESFIEQFNQVQSYLQAKMSITSLGGETPTYTRGTLSGEGIFSELRSDLFSAFISEVSASGSFTSLRQIGLELDGNLQANIADDAALDQALAENFDDVVSLLDGVMAGFDSLLDRFTNNDQGYLDLSVETFDQRLADLSSQIKDWDARLEDRQTQLVEQFGQLQAQLISMTYMQQQWAGIYGSVNRLF